MSRALVTYKPIATGMHSRTAVDTAQTITIPSDASQLPAACFLSAEGQTTRVTFDGTTPTATLGIRIISGAQPVFIPLGEGSTLKAMGEAAGGFLNVMWMA